MKHKYSTAMILDASIHAFFLHWCAYLLCIVDKSNTVSLIAYKLTAFIVLMLGLLVAIHITIHDSGLKIFREVSSPDED